MFLTQSDKTIKRLIWKFTTIEQYTSKRENGVNLETVSTMVVYEINTDRISTVYAYKS